MKALLELLKNIVVFLSGYLTALYLNSENQTFEDNIKYQISYIKKITNNILKKAQILLSENNNIDLEEILFNLKRQFKNVQDSWLNNEGNEVYEYLVSLSKILAKVLADINQEILNQRSKNATSNKEKDNLFSENIKDAEKV